MKKPDSGAIMKKDYHPKDVKKYWAKQDTPAEIILPENANIIEAW